jgi:hypothetical protein
MNMVDAALTMRSKEPAPTACDIIKCRHRAKGNNYYVSEMGGCAGCVRDFVMNQMEMLSRSYEHMTKACNMLDGIGERAFERAMIADEELNRRHREGTS